MAIAAELAFSSVRTLAAKLRQQEFSSVELTEFYLQRTERLGAQLNAVVTLTRSLALAQAARADRELRQGLDRGPLHGIPYGAKDLLATAGIPTSWGAGPLKEQVFDEDATVIARLREAGAVLVAKLAMVEIAGGLGYQQPNASFTGPGLNPWDKNCWSGGSSSGSGSAVAAGMVPFAIGSETWGSITTPAGYCGVTGLRPTYGRVSRHGAMALSWTMDKLGVMSRTADDSGLVLAAIAGADPEDPTCVSRDYAYPSMPPIQPPFRLATIKGAVEHVQGEVRANFEQALNLLARHGTIEEIELPKLPYSEVAGMIITCEIGAAFEGLITSGTIWEMTAPEDRISTHASMFIPAKDYINALRIRRHIQKAVDAILSRFDALVEPTLPTVATPIDGSFAAARGRFRGSSLSGGENASGIPAITVCSGRGERDLPTGIKFVGRAFEENRLIALANLYQQATDWHTMSPKWTLEA